MDKDLVFQDCLKHIFATDEGKIVLKWLTDTYCDGTIYRPDEKGGDRETVYRLGKRDLVRDLIKKLS